MPSFEVHSSSTLVVDVCTDDCTHDPSYYEVSDVDTTSYHSADFGSEHLHVSHWSQSPYHLVGQLKVNDIMIAIAIEHFDVVR